MAKYRFTEAEVKERFERLEDAMGKKTYHNPDGVMLPVGNGAVRKGRADEFMLMHEEGPWTYFKHHDTRNYVCLHYSNNLEIPVTERPFFRGFFGEG